MRGWVLLAVLAMPARAQETLSAPFASISGDVREGAEGLSEKSRRSPRPTIRIISWNVQAFGGRISPQREAAFGEVMGHMLSETRTARILSFQEISNDTGTAKIHALLPGGGERWRGSFTNTNGAMDNGFFVENRVGTGCERLLFARRDERGRWQRERDYAMHTPRAAHMRVGDFDFTLLSVHLTFGGGNSGESARELANILDWVGRYLATPGADPDIIISGDFNLPTRKGRTSSGWALEDVFAQHPQFGHPDVQGTAERPGPYQLVATIDDATSRNREGRPANNYDHFIMTGDVFNEEYVKTSAGVVPHAWMEAVERRHETMVSDHLPISAGFYTSGAGNDGSPIRADGDSACRVLMAMAPLKR